MRTTSWRALVLTIRVCAFAAVVAGASSTASGAPTAVGASARPTANAPKPATAAQWARVVAAAKREGAVTIYSSQSPFNLAAFGERFKQKYGITVTINRNIDSVLTQQVTAEYGTGKVEVDLLVVATKATILGAQQPQNRWAVDAVGPALFAKGYNRRVFAGPGKAVVPGAAITTLVWNTAQWPDGIKTLPDVLNPRLKGRIGVIVPSAFSIIDWYRWVEENYGKSFLPRLAAQEPKLYVSALPMTQAAASGEIAVATFGASTAPDLKAQGAPIDYRVPKGSKTGTWNAPYYAMIMRKAPHPNAAQLLLNFMLTKEGQAIVHRHLGTALAGVPNTTQIVPRKQNLKESTPEKVAAFQRYWDSLFR